ncbi:hypothetical protein FOL47_006563 [Perkinsus chesapeaki]|uniref:Uncharacterized protein n=1 Tax=Perkinsus chesapeaki TaxID=330153 RepID=A0A7J6LR46_PERCH|nr:hypothetical protein FOL47_006563 [Perkinsus chesapeaki]
MVSCRQRAVEASAVPVLPYPTAVAAMMVVATVVDIAIIVVLTLTVGDAKEHCNRPYREWLLIAVVLGWPVRDVGGVRYCCGDAMAVFASYNVRIRLGSAGIVPWSVSHRAAVFNVLVCPPGHRDVLDRKAGPAVPSSAISDISPVEAFRAWDWPDSLKDAIKDFEFVRRLPSGGVDQCYLLGKMVSIITAVTWGLITVPTFCAVLGSALAILVPLKERQASSPSQQAAAAGAVVLYGSTGVSDVRTKEG